MASVPAGRGWLRTGWGFNIHRTEAGVSRSEEPSPTSPSGATGWRPVLPGIGLVLGAGLGLVIALLVATAPAAMVIGVLAGAGLGLVIGASARSHVGGTGTQTRP